MGNLRILGRGFFRRANQRIAAVPEEFWLLSTSRPNHTSTVRNYPELSLIVQMRCPELSADSQIARWAIQSYLWLSPDTQIAPGAIPG